MAFEDVPQPTTIEERLTLARRACEEFELPQDFWIDGLDDQSRALFGDLPSPALIIGPDGKVVAKLPWAEPDMLDSKLDEQLSAVDALLSDPESDAARQLGVVGPLLRARRGQPQALLSAPRPGDGLDAALLALAVVRHRAEAPFGIAIAVLEDTCGNRPDQLAAGLADLLTSPHGSERPKVTETLLRRIVELAGERRPRQAAWARARMRDRTPL
jgi:hypothetical protein